MAVGCESLASEHLCAAKAPPPQALYLQLINYLNIFQTQNFWRLFVNAFDFFYEQRHNTWIRPPREIIDVCPSYAMAIHVRIANKPLEYGGWYIASVAAHHSQPKMSYAEN